MTLPSPWHLLWLPLLWLLARLWLVPWLRPPPMTRPGPCPATPNCVRSAVTGEPWPAADLATLGRAVTALPRCRLLTQEGGYLHAECRSWLWGFIDDLELQLDADGRLHYRSAARLGYSDLGVNQRRITRLRAYLDEAPR